MRILFRAFLRNAAAFLFGFAVLSCAAAWPLVRDLTGAVCPIVVQSTDPRFAPICSSLPEIEAVIQDLASASASASASTSSSTAGASASPPTGDALYHAIVAHRASASPSAAPTASAAPTSPAPKASP